jgi:hypothetical protein
MYESVSCVGCDNEIVVILKNNPYLLEAYYQTHYVEQFNLFIKINS